MCGLEDFASGFETDNIGLYQFRNIRGLSQENLVIKLYATLTFFLNDVHISN
jgi:hypothetical protein